MEHVMSLGRGLLDRLGISHHIREEDVVPGLHIYAYRHGHAYSHHGIAGGKDSEGTRRVYHFRADVEEFQQSSSCRGGKGCVTVGCRSPSDSNSAVVSSCIHCFSRGHSLHYHRYGVDEEEYGSSRSGTCQTEDSSHPDTVYERARSIFNNGFGSYNLAERNCEHFALYCSIGESRPSEQVESLLRLFHIRS